MLPKIIIRSIILTACIISLGYLSWAGVHYYQESQAIIATDQDVILDEDPDQPLQVVKVAAAATVKPNQLNTIQVAAMKVDSQVWEGKGIGTLNKGLWRIPGSSTPDKGGNTVIAAHRWKWLPASKKSFYDIDKVKLGDVITMNWENKTYSYKVSKISTVTPDKVDILQNSDQPKLTLFSCAPLFSTKYRLVVEAELMTT